MALNDFTDDEKLFRAVRPWKIYWSRKTNRPAAAAFKAKDQGLSVERGYHRNDATVVAEMQNHFEGHIVSVLVGQCKDADAIVVHKPTERSEYHSEIHKDNEIEVLDDEQCMLLSFAAVVES